MARRRRMASGPFIRGRVSERVRRGEAIGDIVDDIQDIWPSLSESMIQRLIRDERDRQRAADVLMNRDKRKRIDLAAELGCPPRTGRIRMRLSMRWTDPDTGHARTTDASVEVRSGGRLGDIINEGLRMAIDIAQQRGTNVPLIRSSNVTGRVSYQIESAECV